MRFSAAGGTWRRSAWRSCVATRLIVNNVVQESDSSFLAQKRQQQQYLGQLRERHGDVPIVEIPLFPQEVRGVARLRTVGRILSSAASR